MVQFLDNVSGLVPGLCKWLIFLTMRVVQFLVYVSGSVLGLCK